MQHKLYLESGDSAIVRGPAGNGADISALHDCIDVTMVPSSPMPLIDQSKLAYVFAQLDVVRALCERAPIIRQALDRAVTKLKECAHAPTN